MQQFKGQCATHDVIIVGAGIAGCTAALLFARQGLAVALVERQSSLDDYKPLCTHYLHPGAIPILRELGIYDAVIAAGGLHSSMNLRTFRGEFTVPHGPRERGLNVRRAHLDPLLRRTAEAEPSIDFYLGAKVEDLTWQDGRCTGVMLLENTGQKQALSAALTVAADGRNSPVSKRAGVVTQQTVNDRFSFYAYHKGLARYPDDNVQVWLADEGQGYVAAFPNDHDLTLVSCYVPLREFDQWQGQVATRYEGFVRRQPDAPQVTEATRVSDIMGMRRMPSLRRPSSLPGMALVGDAACAVDPLAGTGCTWALQSARQLVRCTAASLRLPDDRLDKALKRYRRRHWLFFEPQFFMITRFSRAKRFNAITRGLLRLLIKGRKARDCKSSDARSTS